MGIRVLAASIILLAGGLNAPAAVAQTAYEPTMTGVSRCVLERLPKLAAFLLKPNDEGEGMAMGAPCAAIYRMAPKGKHDDFADTFQAYFHKRMAACVRAAVPGRVARFQSQYRSPEAQRLIEKKLAEQGITSKFDRDGLANYTGDDLMGLYLQAYKENELSAAINACIAKDLPEVFYYNSGLWFEILDGS